MRSFLRRRVATGQEMTAVIREMTGADFVQLLALWREAEGVGLGPSDTPEAIDAYLARNPGFSLVAQQADTIVGAVLCGHDGRRGYLYHLAIAPAHRRRGLGRALVERCLAKLAASGILKATVYVFAGNETGQEFWQQTGWAQRPDLVILQREPHRDT